MGALDEEELVTRPVTDPERIAAFRERYRRRHGREAPLTPEERQQQTREEDERSTA